MANKQVDPDEKLKQADAKDEDFASWPERDKDTDAYRHGVKKNQRARTTATKQKWEEDGVSSFPPCPAPSKEACSTWESTPPGKACPVCRASKKIRPLGQP